jgi:hypothetical protein
MEFESMSKSDLESHGRTIGIELDRRLVKSQLIAQLQEFITLKKIEEDMETEDVAYELEVSEHPLHPEFSEELIDIPEPQDDPLLSEVFAETQPIVDPVIEAELQVAKIQEAKDMARMLQRMEEDIRMAETRLLAANIALEDAKTHVDAAEEEVRTLRDAYNQHTS